MSRGSEQQRTSKKCVLDYWGEVTWEWGLEEEKEPSSDELELGIADILATAK